MKISRFKFQILFAVFLIVLVIGSLLLFGKRSDTKQQFDPREYVAVVHGEGIKRSEFEQELRQRTQFFTYAKQDVRSLPSLEKDVLENMIDMKLVKQYAVQQNIRVTEEEITNQYQAKVAANNGEVVYLAKISEMYGMEKEQALESIGEDLLREKVQRKVKKPLAEWIEKEKATSEIKRIL